MSDPVSRETLTATSSTNPTRPMGNTGDVATDLVWVCRSATLPQAQYRFYRAVLLTFPHRGGPPDRELLGHLARQFDVDLEATLTTLASRDLVQRDPTTGAITAAYPFSGVPKPHRVTLLTDPQGSAGTRLYAMCALDALGMPLMLHRPALVTSVDALTGAAVRVRIWQEEEEEEDPARDAGGAESGVPGWRAAWDPATAVVYARPEHPTVETLDTRDIASACRCPVTNFFTAPAQAHRWAEQDIAGGAVLLGPVEAVQRAERRFGGLLDRLPEAEA
jgi:Alkylmercury lyase